MKNFTRVTTESGKYTRLRLIAESGEFDPAFDAFTAAMIERQDAPLTITRYSNAVSQFVDYLVEVNVLGKTCSPTEFDEAVNAYLPARCAPPGTGGESAPLHYKAVRQIGLPQLTRKSAKNAAAAINLFLDVSARQALLNNQVDEWNRRATEAVTSRASSSLTSLTQDRLPAKFPNIVSYSMFANVIRSSASPRAKISRSHAISPRATKRYTEDADLPVEYVMPLLKAASSYRDRAVWALMAGAGLRQSEVAQLLWHDINYHTQQVYIYDPYCRRLAEQLPPEITPRFKGRATSETYILPQLREVFFESLANYIRREHRPVRPDTMVFQDITSSGNGRPYCKVSDKSKVSAFKRACARAGIPRRANGQSYTPHSLRHFYGVFMLNYVPVDGGFGLRLAEVQSLMGHMDQRQTAKYARTDKLILETQLCLIDQLARGVPSEEGDLRAWMASRYRAIAERLTSSIEEER